jgi:hypothetical protein
MDSVMVSKNHLMWAIVFNQATTFAAFAIATHNARRAFVATATVLMISVVIGRIVGAFVKAVAIGPLVNMIIAWGGACVVAGPGLGTVVTLGQWTAAYASYFLLRWIFPVRACADCGVEVSHGE